MRRYLRILIAIVAIFTTVSIIASCGSDNNDDDDDVVVDHLSGYIVVPSSSNLLNRSEITVQTSVDRTQAIRNDSDNKFYFDINSVILSSSSLITATDESNNLLMLGVFDPSTMSPEAIEVSSSSTAMALALMSPFSLNLDELGRSQFLFEAQVHPKYLDLVYSIESALSRENPAFGMNPLTNRAMYQLAAEISVDIFLKAQSDSSAIYAASQSGPIAISDADGDLINISNNSFVYYGAGLYEEDQFVPGTCTLIQARHHLFDVWNWDNYGFSDPVDTEFDFGEGRYGLYLTKGFEELTIDALVNPDNPSGVATLANTCKGIGLILNLVAGLPDSWLGDSKKMLEFVSYLKDIKDAIQETQEVLDEIVSGIDGYIFAIDALLIYFPESQELVDLRADFDDLSTQGHFLLELLDIEATEPELPFDPEDYTEDVDKAVEDIIYGWNDEKEQLARLSVLSALRHAKDGDQLGVICDGMDFLVAYDDTIIDALINLGQGQVEQIFMELLKKLLGSYFTIALTVFQAVDTAGPYAYSMAFDPWTIEFCIEQQEGEIVYDDPDTLCVE